MSVERSADPTNLAGAMLAAGEHAYRVVRPIALGGFSIVYLARRSDPFGREGEREVAIKVLDLPHLHERLRDAPPAFVDPDAPLAQQMAEVRERFLNEAHLLRQLRHPNIVQAFDQGELPGPRGRAPFFVMEYVPGSDVGEIVRRSGALDGPGTRAVVGALLSALAYLEREAVMHRDVKAANVLVRPSARATPAAADVRLIDFGLTTSMTRVPRSAQALFPHEVRTRPGMLWGTLAWCPPERLAPFLSGDDEAPDVQVDLWGTGLLLYLCLTGVQPFDCERFATEADQFAALIENRFPAPRELRPSLTPSLERVVLRALALRPRDRFRDANEFLAALREADPG
ncbi:MAG: serine/threonine protein kinase [Deltaproteobacteria bacterium]|nr:serine/threonine protein kinase [Deltaproteobacteria bacterium]